MTATNESIKCCVTVNTSAKEAFIAFTEKFSTWWPSAYTLSKETLQNIGFEPKEGGACYEIGLHGFRCDWGRVTVWEPPHQLRFTWQVSPKSTPEPNPALASEVRVSFTETAPSVTRVDIEHHNIERHGEGSAQYREELASEYGWPYLIGQYQAMLVVT